MKAYFVVEDGDFIALGYFAAETVSQARYLGWRHYADKYGTDEVGTFEESQGHIRVRRCPKLDGFCGEEKEVLYDDCHNCKVPWRKMIELGLMTKATGEEGEPETDDGYLYNAKGGE